MKRVWIGMLALLLLVMPMAAQAASGVEVDLISQPAEGGTYLVMTVVNHTGQDIELVFTLTRGALVSEMRRPVANGSAMLGMISPFAFEPIYQGTIWQPGDVITFAVAGDAQYDMTWELPPDPDALPDSPQDAPAATVAPPAA